MLIHPTVERLRALGLTAMADAFIAPSWGCLATSCRYWRKIA
jgi:hypothetical protein